MIKRSPAIHLFCCIALISMAGFAHAQSWKELKDRSVAFYQAGKIDSAIVYATRAMDVTEKAFGKNDATYGTDLISVAALYQAAGNYAKAEPLLLQAVSIYKIATGADSRYYAATLSTLAGLYTAMKDYTKTETLYTEALAILKIALGDDHPEYAAVLINMAELYRSMGNIPKAEQLLINAADIRKKALGPQHADYVIALNNLAYLYYSTQAYAKAEPVFLEVLAINKQVYGTETPQYFNALNNVATIYGYLNNYEKEEMLCLEALAISKKALGTEHPLYATSLYNLGHMYKSMGNYAKAVPYCEEALAIRKKALGTEHADYAQNLNELALLYQYTGSYAKAEPLYVEALEIRKKILGTESDDYAQSLNNLAFLYEEMGNYTKATQLCTESVAICKRVLGIEHPHYAYALSNLANLCAKQGNYAVSEQMYTESLAIRKKIFGTAHEDYASCLNNLAALYETMGNHGKAEPMFAEALATRKKILGTEHPDYGTSLNNLALLYQTTGNYTAAEPLYIEALANTKKALGTDHADYAQSLNNLGTLYVMMGHYAKAEPLFLEGKKIILENIGKNFIFLSEEEKGKYMETVIANFDYYHNFFALYQQQKPAIAAEAYNTELATKGIILASGIQLRQSILGSGSQEALTLFDKWNGLKNILARLYSIPISQRRINTDSLEIVAGGYEKGLSRLSTSFRQGKLLAKADWKTVQQTLGPNDVSIEFSSFHTYNNNRATDSTQYMAFVLRKGDVYPAMVKLCLQSQLDTLLNSAGNTNSGFIGGLYRGVRVRSKDITNSDRHRLYKLVWQPVESLLHPGDHIYYSPAGLLHQVAFAAIPDKGDTLLSDRYQLTQLSSTAMLLQPAHALTQADLSVAAFGGIKYDASAIELISMAPKAKTAYVSRGLPDGIRGTGWNYLPGTLQEINSIDSLAKIFHVPITMYRGSSATEERYKSYGYGASPRIIHIATHGFFFPDPEKKGHDDDRNLVEDKQQFRVSANPLNRSGLLLAGANHIWQGESISPGLEDGILTAYEASNVTLTGTELVVLSACETGLGDIKGSEGVFGLQRAFKAAGANYLMMSLWKVPDSETAAFMKEFYRSLFSGQSIENAFHISQTVMKKQYRNDPYKWAAFVLVR